MADRSINPGDTFGRWTAIVCDQSRGRAWLCRCSCGTEKAVLESNLRRRLSTSCGCTRQTDLAGQRFGRLTVIAVSSTRTRLGRMLWECRCDCGNARQIPPGDLLRGGSTSCGCFREEQRLRAVTTHGRSRSLEYSSWAGMIQRCMNSKTGRFSDYGGRGITVCEEWFTFEIFFRDMGPRPSCEHSIDRIDSNGNYEPGNCRWATAAMQTRNTRRKVLLTHQGRTAPLAEWSEIAGISTPVLHRRLRLGWSHERALTTPVAPVSPYRPRTKKEESHA